jgi:hypothetical protein
LKSGFASKNNKYERAFLLDRGTDLPSRTSFS